MIVQSSGARVMRYSPVTLADGRPAYMRAKPRLRQSDIDAQRAWALSDVRAAWSPTPTKDHP